MVLAVAVKVAVVVVVAIVVVVLIAGALHCAYLMLAPLNLVQSLEIFHDE